MEGTANRNQTSDSQAFNIEKFRASLLELVKEAKNNGNVIPQKTIDTLTSEYSLDDEKQDEVASFFENQGIEIYSEDEGGIALKDDEDDFTDDEDASESDLELIEKEENSIEDTSSGYVDLEDPVRMYLKEIGNIDLLNAEQEIYIATRMEDGRIAHDLKKKFIKDKDIKVTKEMIDVVFKAPDDTEEEKATSSLEMEKKYRLFTGLQRSDLVSIEQDGKHAEGELSEANLRLVVSIAKKYIGHGMPFLDLIQEGNIGLLKAVDKFDYRKGFKFSTYATWWIRQAITRAIADQSRTIRVPVHMVETINKFTRARRALTVKLGRDPLPEEIAKEMRVPEGKVLEIIKISQEPVSLETPVGEEDDSNIGDFVADEKITAPETAATETHLRQDIDDVLATLTEREQQVMRLRYGLDDGRPKTLEEVGRIFGVTRERIRQIEAKALRKLSRNPSKSRKLRDYLD